MTTIHNAAAVGMVVISCARSSVWAQAAPVVPTRTDSLQLSALQAAAVAADPRARQLGLQATSTELRLRNIAAEQLPALTGNGQAQLQSAVTKFGAGLPPGVNIPTPRRDTYDAHIEAQQVLFDASVAPRRAVERAQLVENQAQVRATLYPLRQEVSDAFFTALAAQERESLIAAAIHDLEARLAESARQYQQGAATPADTASFAAALLERRQDLSQARADRSAAIARLAELVGRPLDDTVPLAVPDLAVPAAAALRALDQLRARPEYAEYAATRARLFEQEAVEAAREKPRFSAFGRLGYGRPGLNLLSTSFQTYWLAGVQAEWTPWTWGTVDRSRQLLEIERELATTNEAAFTQTLRRSVQQAVATMARLDTTLALDERIVALRERIEQTARARLSEGAITAADYADRYSELVSARVTRAQHVVELAQTRASFLTTLGVEAP